MRIASAEDIRSIDRRAETEYGIAGLILMENAGLRVVEAAERMLEKSGRRRVVVVAGKGNNGGDGLVAARHLMNAGSFVDIFVLGVPEQMTPDTRTNYEILDRMGANLLPLMNEDDLNPLMLAVMNCDLIIDAMYGTSFKGSLNEYDSKITRVVNWAASPVLSVDLPSGVEPDTGRVTGEAIQASWTVALALPKFGLLLDPGQQYAGNVTVADISIPAALLNAKAIKNNLITEEMVRAHFGPRSRNTHKGTYGHVLAIGGSVGMTGAVTLTAWAALAAGAGLVTAAVPESVQPLVEGALAEVMTVPLAQTGGQAIATDALPVIRDLLSRVSVCAIGPGMSRYPEAHAVIRNVLEYSKIPVVIDADGLNALSEDVSILKNRQIPIVLTPHPGEMARLLGSTIEKIQSDRVETARRAAIEWGVTVLLKGSRTIVAEPNGETYLNLTGNPGMATAGSGDVLTGIIAGLIAQGMKANVAAGIGAYLHGRAGDAAKELKGEHALTASDLIRALSEVLKPLEHS
ncbi:MAG: NAD(P)H-hydrate dehydratase [Solirubrobacterales bacterium]